MPDTKRISLVAFSPASLWKALSRMCQRAGLGNEPHKVFEELKELRCLNAEIGINPQAIRNDPILRRLES